jgi:hypothetical protein
VAGTIARLAWRTVAYLAMMVLALAFFLPVRLLLGGAGRAKAPAVEA